ncbi:MAG: class I SAM-dependent methyltransferase [Steroidobacter sp.]
MKYAIQTALIVMCFALTACSKKSEEPPATTAPADATAAADDAAGVAPEIDASIANAERLEGDREEDEWRKPAVVLAYLEVKPGMRVVDYLAGGGYYTELLSRIVGPDGQVIAYNNAPYLKYAAEKPAKRYGENRLPNVVQLTTPPEAAPLEPNNLDAALFVQSYHDLYWRTKDNSWPATDPAKALATLVRALKSGAVVVVVDHVAAPGSDPAVSVDATHRIDPAVVKRDFEAAGLVFDGESDAFSSSEDDHTKEVFDASIRHKTDQFMYRFRKP